MPGIEYVACTRCDQLEENEIDKNRVMGNIKYFTRSKDELFFVELFLIWALIKSEIIKTTSKKVKLI